MYRALVLALIMTTTSAAHAEGSGRTVWTIVGASAGFGVGVWAGFAAFDQARYAERKIWTSAIVGAAIGGVGGYFIGRAQDQGSSSPARTFRPIDSGIADTIGRSVRLGQASKGVGSHFSLFEK